MPMYYDINGNPINFQPKKQTNEQWLKSLDTEELAQHIRCKGSLKCENFKNCDECKIYWLKQECKE